MTGMIPVGEIEAAADLTTGALIDRSSASQVAVDRRIGKQVLPLVADAIADDDSVRLAAIAAMKDAAVIEGVAWTRGRIEVGANPDTWSSADNRRGQWDVPNTSAANALVTAGFTFPDAPGPLLLTHVDDSAGIGGSIQRVVYTSGDLIGRTFERQRAWAKPFGPWTENLRLTGEANAKRGRPVNASSLNPDLWTKADQGVWDFDSIATLTPSLLAGYTPPSGDGPHLLQHLEHSSTQEATQIAWVGHGRHRVLWRQRRYGQIAFDPWQSLTPSPLASTVTDSILAIGDSWVEGGQNGVLWDDGSEWPAKLATILGIPVINAGKGGAVSDEVALTIGAKKTLLKITGGVIPASGTADVELSWTPYMKTPRWFSRIGMIHGASVYLEQNVTTGKWTIRRSSASQLAAGQAVPAAGWVEWSPHIDDKQSQMPLIIRVGGNDLSVGGTPPRPNVVDHTVASITEIIESRPYRAHSCVLLGLVPQVGISTSRDFTQAVNAALKARFPRQYWDVLGYMQDLGSTGALADCGLQPTENDRTLISSGYPPASLYSGTDVTHPGKAFHAALAAKLATFIRSQGIVQPA